MRRRSAACQRRKLRIRDSRRGRRAPGTKFDGSHSQLVRDCLAGQSISLAYREGLFMVRAYHRGVIHKYNPR